MRSESAVESEQSIAFHKAHHRLTVGSAGWGAAAGPVARSQMFSTPVGTAVRISDAGAPFHRPSGPFGRSPPRTWPPNRRSPCDATREAPHETRVGPDPSIRGVVPRLHSLPTEDASRLPGRFGPKRPRYLMNRPGSG
jgi:hypothetical protein